MKEYNVYINREPVRGDIVVYSIPLRDGIRVFDKLTVNSEVGTPSMKVSTSAGQSLAVRSDVQRVLCKVNTKTGEDSYLLLSSVLNGILEHVSSVSDSSMAVYIGVDDLSKVIPADGIEQQICVSSVVGNTDAYLSSGMIRHEAVIEDDIAEGGMCSNKLLSVDEPSVMNANIQLTYELGSGQMDTGFCISSSVDIVCARQRLLSDMDSDNLAVYKDMSMAGTDYIILNN